MAPSQRTPSRLRSLKGDKVSVRPEAALEPAPRAPGTAEALGERFEVREQLGQGGMGAVFAAEDKGLGRVVALKRLRDELAQDRGALRRFVLEAQIGSQLEHPNIVPLYSFERTEQGAPAIAMQLLDGQTMADFIAEAAAAPAEERQEGAPFGLKERLGPLLGVCDAIHFAHERGVVHRDLKPENVMLGRYHEVYVMDWGLARVAGQPETAPAALSASPVPPSLLEAREGPGLANTLPSPLGATVRGAQPSSLATQQGTVMGTPQYMAPEQAQGRTDAVGPPSDQYALGLMAQELATLRSARTRGDPLRALTEARRGQLGPFEDVDGDALHPALAAVILRATAPAPLDRYPSVAALAEDLRRFVRGEPVSVFPEGLARRAVRQAARRPALATGLVAGAALVALLGFALDLARDRREARAHASELEQTRRVLLAVGDKAHAVDDRLSDVAAALHAVAAAAVEVNARPGDGPPLPDGEPAYVPSERYGGVGVSFDRLALHWPGQAAGTAAPASARKLQWLDRWLRNVLAESLPSELADAGQPVRDAALAAGKSELLRSFVGLEDGAFVQFPARALPGDFDPRARPWYRAGLDRERLHWTRPALSMAGKSLRLGAVLALRAEGKVLGVAGCDLRVPDLARQLALDLPGFRRAYLVSEDGLVVVRDDLEARAVASGAAPDADVPLQPVEHAALAAHIAARDPGGLLDLPGGGRIAFARLVSPPWTYVAELDAVPGEAR